MSNSSDDLNVADHHEFLQSGDVVAGSYNDDGRKYKNASSPDTAVEIERRRAAIARSAMHGGGELIKPNKKTKAAKPIKTIKRNVKIQQIEPPPLTPEITSRELAFENVNKQLRTIYLHNKLGRIKMKVEDVLNSEMAYCLVFASEDDVIFTPNAGETLNFVDVHGDTHEVYYANTLFSWCDGIKQLMILFKRDE